MSLSEPETEARRDEKAFKSLANTAPIIVWISDSKGAITFLNSRWVEYTGRAAADADWSAVLHPEDRNEAGNAFRTAVAEFSPFRFQARLLRADGAWRWHDVTGSPSENHLPGSGFVGHAIDVHDGKMANDRLRAQRDLIWTLSSDLIAILDRDGKVVIANPAWKDIFGESESDMTGYAFRNFVAQDKRAFFDDMLSSLIRTGRDGSIELEMEHHDVRRRVAWTGKFRTDSVYLAGRDVTEERNAETALMETQEELRQSQKMEAIGQLTGGIAHDFNNLLTGIVGGLSMAQLKLRLGQASEVERFINLAAASAKKAGSLTHRLLAFSRRQSLEVRTVDANAVVRSMADMLSRTVGDAVIVETELDARQLAVRIDVNQLENALLNLTINARDAMGGSGRLSIRSRLCENATKFPDGKVSLPDGKYVVIAVADTGAGMDSETLSRAADPFFTTKPQGEGTGLGLPMVYGFVEQSGGAVRIDSTPGKGTQVRLYIPLSSDPIMEASPDRDDVEVEDGASVSVMIVEDHEMVRTLAGDILTNAGFEVSAFEDGEAALDAIAEGRCRPDVLVTDVGLPGIDGRHLATEVLRRLPSVSVVFVTGHGEGEIVNAGDWGRFETVIKPFAVRELISKVTDAARRSSALVLRENVA